MSLETIHIVSSSYIIREGLKLAIQHLAGGFMVEESTSWEEFIDCHKKKIGHQTLFIDTKIIPGDDKEPLLDQIADREVLIVLLHSTEDEITGFDGFDAICYDISKESLITKLSNLLLNGKTNEAGKNVLSERELMVLKEVALGLTNKEISEKLFISMHTVITHRKNITAKLGIKTISGLTVYAMINNLISPSELNK